jgi:hypothetical protein
MFDVAIDSKLRGCGIVKIKIGDLVSGGRVRSRAIVIQQKTASPVQFELLPMRRAIVIANAANTAPAQMVGVITWESIAYTTARRQIYPE